MKQYSIILDWTRHVRTAAKVLMEKAGRTWKETLILEC